MMLFHLPLGKCNVKSDEIQTFGCFREKHHVSKTRTNLNQRAMQISSSTSQHANLNETWILIPHFSNEKQIVSCVKMQLSFFISFPKTKPTQQPLLSYGEVYFLLQHQCFNILLIVHHKITNLVSRCKVLSPI